MIDNEEHSSFEQYETEKLWASIKYEMTNFFDLASHIIPPLVTYNESKYLYLILLSMFVTEKVIYMIIKL